ncbi:MULTISPECIES: NAD(P)H-binding protein [Sphingobium]|jgi:NAD(P)H dehydrogenase (quinone)|uniref:NAD(P)-binding domain-containing protein n=2 Tax=Sphingobium TaxID=165695 RepID=T0IGQ0_9SPHN|nr:MULTISPECIES: NAD(P)H-binding protein [Sphingobium]EQB10835.1 hypothetical protein RLDS_25705 [Sphingobium lactosutens DS20]QDC36530.1 NAD-dependent epimerase/dehydratase family protein [Sphingobium fuliginis ATCC 27551]
MYVVTGASGQLGAAIVEQLLKLLPAEKIGASVRNPDKALGLAERGVRVRAGDFADPASLDHAFEGASRILIVSSNTAATGGDPLMQHRNAIEAARKARVERLFYTSQMAADPASAFAPARDHAASEAMLQASGIPWTAFRHGYYAESAPMIMGDWRRTGVVAAPADGKVAWTTHEDLATADALLFARDHAPDGPTAPLTGSEALDFADLADLATMIGGTEYRRDILADAIVRERMASRGMPPEAIDISLGMFMAARSGEFSKVDPTMEKLLGRKPQSMREVLTRALAV